MCDGLITYRFQAAQVTKIPSVAVDGRSRRSRQRQQLRIEPLQQLHGDPPIVECDTSFDDDKQQNNRLTREEFDDDCWGTNPVDSLRQKWNF